MGRFIRASLVIGILAAGAYWASPAVRCRVQASWHDLAGWTEAARRADPVGYISFAQRKLRRHLASLRQARSELNQQLHALERNLQQKQLQFETAAAMAKQLRALYRLAAHDPAAPLRFRGGLYSQEQLERQVASLLAEMDACQQAIGDYQTMKTKLQDALQELVSRLYTTEARIELLDAQRELAHAQGIGSEVNQLLADLDKLINDNDRYVATNPVRTLKELIAAESKPHEPATPAPADRVARFLDQVPDTETSPVPGRQTPAPDAAKSEQDNAPNPLPPTHRTDRIRAVRSGRIYTQS